MKYFVLGTVVLAAAFIIGCDSSGGVCCKGGKARGGADPVVKEIKPVQNENNMTISYYKTLKTYDWNVTTEGDFPTDANCTFVSHEPVVVIPKVCFTYNPSNTVNVGLKGVDEDNNTIDETKTPVWSTPSPSGSGGEDGGSIY